jgi:hypothetical protein
MIDTPMNRAPSILLTLILTCAIPFAAAQQPNWNMDGLHEVNASIQTLPLQDRQGIKRAVAERPVNPHIISKPPELRAVRINTPSGHIFLVQASDNFFCSPIGNCAFWVLSSAYKILLDTNAQQFKVQTLLHSGHPDILTKMHGGATEGDLKQWRFNGIKYHRIACESYEFRDADGNDLKQPHITPCASR